MREKKQVDVRVEHRGKVKETSDRGDGQKEK